MISPGCAGSRLAPPGSMVRLVSLLALVAGCNLYFDDDDGIDQCAIAAAEVATGFRNPDDLTCVFVPPACPAGCACPELGLAAPTWGQCFDACESLDEAACIEDDRCRVVRNARCAVTESCEDSDFLGCFPTDSVANASRDCIGLDALACSQSNQCTAFHDPLLCAAIAGPCPAIFEMCLPEGMAPGTCGGEVDCDEQPPACDRGQTPGIADGCYTGACIPRDLCSE